MPALHNLYRKTSKRTAAIAGTTVLASSAVAASLFVVAPATSARQAAYLGSRGQAVTAGHGRTAGLATYTESLRLLQVARSRLALREMHRRAKRIEARRAAARRAAARRAAQRRAARRAAAQQAGSQQGGTAGGSSSQPSGSPQQIAAAMLGSYGWPSSQFSCLQSLWNVESGWNVYASNPSTGAYGIPQALPGSKMASAGPDWQTNAATQIRWGLGYIKALYGSPCGAWSHQQATGWY